MILNRHFGIFLCIMKHVLLFIFSFLVACSTNKTESTLQVKDDTINVANETDSIIVVSDSIEEEDSVEEDIVTEGDTSLVKMDKYYYFTKDFAGMYNMSSNVDTAKFDKIYCVYLNEINVIAVFECLGYWQPELDRDGNPELTEEGDTIQTWFGFDSPDLRQYLKLSKIGDEYCTFSILDSIETKSLSSIIHNEMSAEALQEKDYKYFDYFENTMLDENLDLIKQYISTSKKYKFIKDNFPYSFTLSCPKEDITFSCIKRER